MRRVFVLALPLAVANNVFNSLSLEEARRHCPMPPNRMHEDVRSCTARLMVVVPCFGQEKTVMHSLRSIWAQACVKDVVVFDDDPQRGHTCARRLLSDSEASSRQVEVVRNPYNLGLAGVRNAGLELAAEGDPRGVNRETVRLEALQQTIARKRLDDRTWQAEHERNPSPATATAAGTDIQQQANVVHRVRRQHHGRPRERDFDRTVVLQQSVRHAGCRWQATAACTWTKVRPNLLATARARKGK